MDNILKQNIIKELNIDSLPEEKQEEILMGIGRIVFQGVLIRILNELNDKDKEDFEKLLESNPDDGEIIINFLENKIPNLKEIIAEETAKFKGESNNIMDSIQ